MPKRKLLIFGASLGGARLKKVLLRSEKLIAFVDNDPAKHGTKHCGNPVVSTKEAIKLDYDVIIIASQSYTQIGQQLLSLGIPKDKIEVADAAILRGDYEPSRYKASFVFLAVILGSVTYIAYLLLS